MRDGSRVMAMRGATIRRAIQTAADRGRSPATDRELLRRFADAGDQDAFEALVRRHTGLVLSVCRRTLTNTQDAEDACQATFLVLARKARAGRWQPSIANWLFATARKVSRDLRRAAERRAKREGRAAVPESVPPVDQMTGRELLAVIDEELGRLPPIYREPLLLYFQAELTRDEIAARLGVPAGTVKIRLERGRKRLGDALTKRGVLLGAGLLALMATSPAGASPPRLIEAIQATVAGEVPPAVAALARGVAVNGVLEKSFVVLAVIAAAALGLGLSTMPPTSAGQPPVQPAPKPVEPAKAEAAKRADPVAGEKAFAGRVLDPDGKPVAGAKLYALYFTPKVMPIPERGRSDKDGGFRFSVPKKEFDRSASATPWDEVMVVAVAEGYGLGLPEVRGGRPPAHTDLALRLVKDDAPITGRLRDLEGKPVAGAAAVVREFWWPADGGDLKEFAATLKRDGELHPALMGHRLWQTGTWMGRDIGRILPPAVTDAEGRFVLKGVGRERVVGLAVEGPTMATTELWAMTRPGETLRVAAQRRGQPGEVTFAGAAFEQVVPPGRAVVGTVWDKETGKPIPGAVVESYMIGGMDVARTHLRTVADKDGGFRLLGLPKGVANQIRAGPPDGEPYLAVVARVPDAPGLEPATVDVKLKRGVWIAGKVTDKVTGKPVAARIQYAVDGDNPNLPQVPGLTIDRDMRTRPEDGTFRFVGLPGRGVVAAQAHEPGRYRTGAGTDRIKDLDRFLTPAGGGRGLFSPEDSHAVAEVNPEKGAESATCDLVLVAGTNRTGTVVGPDGKPLAGALVCGLEHPDVWDDRPAASAEFSVRDLKPGEPRLIQVSHPEKKLAGSLVVRGDEKEPLAVKLEPAGVLTGRFVTTDGKPLAGLKLFAQIREAVASPGAPSKADVTVGSFPRGPRTDRDGKFRLEGLAPGLKYRLGVHRGMFGLTPEGDLAKGVTVKAGETKDLGDIPIRLPEK